MLFSLFLEELIVGSSDNLAQRCSLLLWQKVSGLKELSMNKLPVFTVPAPSLHNFCPRPQIAISPLGLLWVSQQFCALWLARRPHGPKAKAECMHRGLCVGSSLSAAASSPTCCISACISGISTCPRATLPPEHTGAGSCRRI